MPLRLIPDPFSIEYTRWIVEITTRLEFRMLFDVSRWAL